MKMINRAPNHDDRLPLHIGQNVTPGTTHHPPSVLHAHTNVTLAKANSPILCSRHGSPTFAFIITPFPPARAGTFFSA